MPFPHRASLAGRVEAGHQIQLFFPSLSFLACYFGPQESLFKNPTGIYLY